MITYFVKFGEEILHHLHVAVFFKVYRHGLAFGSQVPFLSFIQQTKYDVKTKKTGKELTLRLLFI